jgi:hypothetical protein
MAAQGEWDEARKVADRLSREALFGAVGHLCLHATGGIQHQCDTAIALGLGDSGQAKEEDETNNSL